MICKPQKMKNIYRKQKEKGLIPLNFNLENRKKIQVAIILNVFND
jgi:hypothetical protein